MRIYFATWNNQNHKVLQKFLKNTSDSNPHRLNVLMCIFEPIFNPCYENRSHIFQNSLLIILFAICNETNAFISPPALTMCLFYSATAIPQLNVASVRYPIGIHVFYNLSTCNG